jgi:hypothetical protein
LQDMCILHNSYANIRTRLRSVFPKRFIGTGLRSSRPHPK